MVRDLILHHRSQAQLQHFLNHLPHALIIDGSEGVGVTHVAKVLAHTVESPELLIQPKKKVKNEFVIDMNEGMVVIEDIRQLYTQTRTQQTGKHVYIIDTGSRSMTVGAQNALLKLLEEPHADLHFIITTHHVDRLLPTIVSRCQRLTLLDITDKQTSDFIERLGIQDAMKARRLAFVGRGKPALITRLANNSELYDARVNIMSDAKTMLGSDIYKKMTTVHTYKDNRADSLLLLEDIMYQLHTILPANPDIHLAHSIDKYIEAHRRISDGGNIRLQLTASLL
jgi:DNA polymerase III subunit delta'|tara:strand:+ start:8893 stop:9741 length:849 start_codon:yes stop_codon:yes gene_type:complete